MRRTFIRIAAALALVATLLLPAANVQASTPLAQAQTAAKKLQAQIARLDGRMKTAAGRYTLAKQQLAEVQSAMTAKQNERVAAQARLAGEQDALAQYLVVVYKMPRTEILDALLSARGWSEVLSVYESVSKISRQGATVVASLTATKNELLKQQKTLAGEQKQATKLLAQIRQEEAQISQTIQTRQTMLGQAQGQVTTILRQMAAARAAAAQAAAAAAAHKQQAAAATPKPSGSPSPAASSYTPQSWARALLQQCHLPVTTANLRAVVAWEMAEGGHWSNTARYNPLNTTMPEPGAVAMNSVGVKVYTSWNQGFGATIATLFNGLYQNILAALKSGNNAQAVADAVGSSPWGTSPFTVP